MTKAPLKKYHVATCSLLNLCFKNIRTGETVNKEKESFYSQLSCYFVYSAHAVHTSCLFSSEMSTKLFSRTHNSLDCQSEQCFFDLGK